MLGLRFCARAFSSCGERGPLFIAVRGPLTVAASPVVEHRLQSRRLSSCGSRAQTLRSMWDPPRPGLEPVSPALAGRPSTTAPPGKPHEVDLVERGAGDLACPYLVPHPNSWDRVHQQDPKMPAMQPEALDLMKRGGDIISSPSRLAFIIKALS